MVANFFPIYFILSLFIPSMLSFTSTHTSPYMVANLKRSLGNQALKVMLFLILFTIQKGIFVIVK